MSEENKVGGDEVLSARHSPLATRHSSLATRHSLNTALACCLATGVSYLFRLPSGQLAPVFAFLLMTVGMPSPRLNWLLALFAITASALGSALILLAFHDALFLYLAVALLWIFTVLLFSNWYSLPATMGAMVSALGIFVFFQGTVGDTLRFYVAYDLNWWIGGSSVVVVDTLLRPNATRQVIGPRAVAARTRLLDVHSLRSSTKLVVLLLLLLLEEGLLGFPGGSQVAFFATFFASTGNLGRQSKTDLFGLAGLLGGFLYGVVAAFLTTRLPHFPLVLALVFLGEFLANLTFQRLPRYGAAGLQAGLAIPFAYLATGGPEWGSFATGQTRIWGLVVAGSTAVVVHAYLWPVLPMRQLRASIAAALRATAASLTRLFGPARSAWEGAPPGLGETVTRSHELLEDARYLPGPDHADPAYIGILACLEEIAANLEYVHFLVGLQEEHPLRQRFFQTIGDYAEQARGNLERVARQFQQSPRRAADLEPIRWEPDTSGRWESAARDVGAAPDRQSDPCRLAIIAQCLDRVARVVAKMSGIAWEINQRNRDR
jgi:hypothetical protein